MTDSRTKQIVDIAGKYIGDTTFIKDFTKQMFVEELARIHSIASGNEYYDYDNQEWIEAVS